jgi:hypothetical protein
MRGIIVAVLAPTFRQHEFFLRLQHGKPLYLVEISSQGAGRRS